MVDIKISELAPAAGVDDTMLIETALAGFTNNKITVAQLSDKIINTDLGITTTKPNAIQKTNAAADGLEESDTRLTEPVANQFQMTNGTTDFIVSADCTIDQDLSTSSNVSFNKVNSDDVYDINNNRVLAVDDSTREQLFVGKDAGANTQIAGNAYRNTAIGNRALNANVEGNANTAVGFRSLYSNAVTGDGLNTAIGTESLANATGVRNQALGSNAGWYQTGGDQNVYIGAYAGNGIASHSKSNNVMIGYASGSRCEGSGNVFIGDEAGYHESGSNKLYIQNNNSSSPLIYGEFDNDQVVINGGLTGNGDFYLKRTATAIDYNPSALTTDDIVAITDTSVTRSVIISTEDVQSGSPTNPRIMIIKDEDGNATTNNIIISLESGTIDGNAIHSIKNDYGSVILYLDGTNGFVYANRLVDSVAGIPENNIYYTGKHGNDVTGTGLNIEEAFLTIQKSIDTAETKVPTIAKQFTIKIFDSGRYVENLVISKPFVHLEAESVSLYKFGIGSVPILDISYTDSGYTNIDISNLDSFSGITPACRVNTPNGTVFLRIKQNDELQAPPLRVEAGTAYLWMDICQSDSLHCIEVGNGATLYANILRSQGSILLADNAKAFIKINSNFTGFISAGANSQLTLICASRDLLSGDAINATAKVRVIEIDKEAEPEQNILYLEQTGDDNRSGRRREDAIFTWNQGVSLAATDVSLSNPYTLTCNSASVYNEALAISQPYIHIDSQNATFNTTASNNITISYILSGYTFLKFGRIKGGGGPSTPAISVNTPSATVHILAEEMENNTAPVIEILGGKVYVKSNYLYNSSGPSAPLSVISAAATLYCDALEATGSFSIYGNAVCRFGSLDGNISVWDNATAEIFVTGSFTGVITAGVNSKLILICGERSIIGSDTIDSTATVRIVETHQEAKPEENIYYIESFGDDNRNGKRIEEAFATWAQIFSTVAAESPAYLNQFTLKSSSSGNYQEQASSAAYHVNIDAPNTVLRSNSATGDTLSLSGGDNRVTLKEIYANSSDNALKIDVDTTFNAYVHTNNVLNVGTGYGLSAIGGYTFGHVDCMSKMHVGPNGIVNLVINKQEGDLVLDDGSEGSLIIGNKSGSITKGANSSVNVLDLTNGLGVPFMTQTQRLALSPRAGTVVFDTDDNRMYYWDGVIWIQMGEFASKKKQIISIGDSDTPYNVSLNESNSFINVGGISSDITIYLPIANADAVGTLYTFKNSGTTTVDIWTKITTDYFVHEDYNTSNRIQSILQGAIVEIICLKENFWNIQDVKGVWRSFLP